MSRLALSVCLLAACARTQGQTPVSRPNIVVILVDTLRADRIVPHDNSRGLTPFIDSLAQHAIVFHHAYAQAPWTNPSVASLFTSRYQSQHAVVNFAATLRSAEITLAEVLHEHGYATGGFLANGLVNGRLGFDQGFDKYVSLWGTRGTKPKTMEKVRTGTINGLAAEWLDKLSAGSRSPFFLYVHYIDPHSPYEAPEPFLDVAARGRRRPDIKAIRARMVAELSAGAKRLNDGTLGDIMTLYDAEVAGVDAGVRELYGTLERLGLVANTIIVFLADHGEAFQEHGYLGHGAMLYDEVIRVPLLLILPGEQQRVDVEEPVALVDVAPTLLNLIGCPAPPSFEGRALESAVFRARHPWLAALRQAWRRDAAPPPVFSERIVPDEREDRQTHHERAVIAGARKLIVGMKGELEGYDIGHDPDERTRLSRGDETLAEVVSRFRARVARTSVEAPPIDPELRERMRALGYVD